MKRQICVMVILWGSHYLAGAHPFGWQPSKRRKIHHEYLQQASEEDIMRILDLHAQQTPALAPGDECANPRAKSHGFQAVARYLLPLERAPQLSRFGIPEEEKQHGDFGFFNFPVVFAPVIVRAEVADCPPA